MMFLPVPRLRSQLAEKESDHGEAVASLQAKNASEIQTLKELLASSEANNTDLQKEVCACTRMRYSESRLSCKLGRCILYSLHKGWAPIDGYLMYP